MTRCLCLLALASALASAADLSPETLRGKLILHDERVDGFQMEARGHFTAPDRFTIDPQHTRALLVRDHGRLKMITYWCDVCGIRAYTPGPCVCCQKETTLDLRDPDDIQ